MGQENLNNREKGLLRIFIPTNDKAIIILTIHLNKQKSIHKYHLEKGVKPFFLKEEM
jgi:hypothetical protein